MSDEEPNELEGDYIEAISKASGIVIKDEKVNLLSLNLRLKVLLNVKLL